jgi:DNA-binding transcriptional regulator YiaG
MSTEKPSRNMGRVDREAIGKLSAGQRDALAARAMHEIGMSEGPLKPERADLRPDVKAIRESSGLSQSQFATKYGLSVKTVQHWEQGRTVPDRPALVLLKTIEVAPAAVEDAVLSLSRPTGRVHFSVEVVSDYYKCSWGGLSLRPQAGLDESTNDRHDFATVK